MPGDESDSDLLSVIANATDFLLLVWKELQCLMAFTADLFFLHSPFVGERFPWAIVKHERDYTFLFTVCCLLSVRARRSSSAFENRRA